MLCAVWLWQKGKSSDNNCQRLDEIYKNTCCRAGSQLSSVRTWAEACDSAATWLLWFPRGCCCTLKLNAFDTRVIAVNFLSSSKSSASTSSGGHSTHAKKRFKKLDCQGNKKSRAVARAARIFHFTKIELICSQMIGICHLNGSILAAAVSIWFATVSSWCGSSGSWCAWGPAHLRLTLSPLSSPLLLLNLKAA